VATPDPGTEQLFWNPAAVAHAARREFALHYGGFFVGPMVAGATVLPMGRAGVLGAGIAVLNYGTQETGDGDIPAGSISQQSYIFQATYAATFGSRASAGVTFKSTHFVGTCSGLCPPIATFSVSTSAVDLGMQVRASEALVVAATLRHAGLRFQVNDEPQSDPLPTRLQAGASYRLRMLEDDLPETVVRVNADVIARARAPHGTALRVGADVAWREQFSVRMGYVDGAGEGTGFSVGIGFVVSRAEIEIAHSLGGGAGAPRGSSYFSLRGRW
jgi:hypothetical protein